MILVLEYPRCSTCKKALQWLRDNGVAFEDRHIVEQNPTQQELTEWYHKSGLPLKRFFNTSGNLYKEQGLKDKLPGMSEEEHFRTLNYRRTLFRRNRSDVLYHIGYKVCVFYNNLIRLFLA